MRGAGLSLPQESENIGERAVRVQDKCRAAAVRARAHAEVTVSTKILVDNNSIIPLTDGACGKFVVDHSLFYGAGSKIEIAVRAGLPGRAARRHSNAFGSLPGTRAHGARLQTPAPSGVLRRDEAVPGVNRYGPGELEAQRLFEDLLNGPDRDKHEFSPDIFGHVLEIALILFWQDHLPDPRPVCREHLLFDPADRENRTAQRDLAGHRKVRIDSLPGNQRRERREDRHAGRWAILWGCSRRDVDVNVARDKVKPVLRARKPGPDEA